MKDILIGERYVGKLGKSLENQGFLPIPVPDNPYLDSRLACHVDLSVIKLEENRLILAKYLEESQLVNYLTKKGYKVIISDKKQDSVYPGDTNLCACIAGRHMIHNYKNTDPAILANSNYNKINIKQSYSKCSICVVADDAIITADSAVAAAAAEKGIDVLRIAPGGIILDGFNEGFIGGASFSTKDIIYFTGMIDRINLTEIEQFISKPGKTTVYLTNDQIFDIGGAIVL